MDYIEQMLRALPELRMASPPGQRGMWGGGDPYYVEYTDVIQYITINSLSNSQAFGDLLERVIGNTGCSNGNSNRGIFMGGVFHLSTTRTNVISYVTTSTLGDANDFGDLSDPFSGVTGVSNARNNRGVCMGGYNSLDSPNWYYNNIQHITISTFGNANDFGDLDVKKYGALGCDNGSLNRGIYAAGGGAGGVFNIIEYININSLGNSAHFGNIISDGVATIASCSNRNNNRGIFASKFDGDTGNSNEISYITLTSLGNADDFGDMSEIKYGHVGTSNGIGNRGVFGGGGYYTELYVRNVIEYIDISSLSNSSDFGELDTSTKEGAALSNG